MWKGKRKGGKNQEGKEGRGGSKAGEVCTVSLEMQPWPRPHLKAIVMSRVELPDSFLPSESIELPAQAPAAGWTLDQGLQPGPALLGLLHSKASQPCKEELPLAHQPEGPSQTPRLFSRDSGP